MCMVKQIGYIILAYQLTKLPELQKRGSTRADDATVRTRDAHAKARMKRYADDRAHATQRNIEKGEVVLVQQKKVNKLSTPYAPTPLVVSETKGTMITARRPDGSSITRNSSKFRRIRGMRANDIEHATANEQTSDDDDDDVDVGPPPVIAAAGPPVIAAAGPPVIGRPQRTRKKVIRLIETM